MFAPKIIPICLSFLKITIDNVGDAF